MTSGSSPSHRAGSPSPHPGRAGDEGGVERSPGRPLAGLATALPAVLTLLAWGRTLGVGLLGADLAHAAAARAGAEALLAGWSAGPLPALPWLLSFRLGGGAILLHALSLLLHAGAALLVTAGARRLGAERNAAVAVGALFAVLPLHPAAVAHLSAMPLLASAVLGLAALVLATGRPEAGTLLRRGDTSPLRAEVGAALARVRGVAAPAILYALALACSPSALLLPLVVPWLDRGRRALRAAAALSVVGAASVVARRLLGGSWAGVLTVAAPGASSDAAPSPQLAPSPAVRLAEALGDAAVDLLVGFRDAVPFGLPLATATLLLLLVVAIGGRLHRRPGLVVAATSAALLVAVPALPSLAAVAPCRPGPLLYLPAAVLLLALARGLDARPRSVRGAVVVLLALWTSAATWNTAAWVEASDRVDAAVTAMEHAAPRYPAGATVLVDSPARSREAPVLGDDPAAAARLAGLRNDVQWRRGTSAALGPAAAKRLGHDLFVIEAGPGGEPVDRTACERRLWETVETAPPDEPVARWRVAVLAASDAPADWRRLADDAGDDGTRVVELTPPQTTAVAPAEPVAVHLVPAACGDAEPVRGTVRWHHPGIEPFGPPDGRRFQLDPAAGVATPLRLPTGLPAVLRLQVTFDRGVPVRCLQELAVTAIRDRCGA